MPWPGNYRTHTLSIHYLHSFLSYHHPLTHRLLSSSPLTRLTPAVSHHLTAATTAALPLKDTYARWLRARVIITHILPTHHPFIINNAWPYPHMTTLFIHAYMHSCIHHLLVSGDWGLVLGSSYHRNRLWQFRTVDLLGVFWETLAQHDLAGAPGRY